MKRSEALIKNGPNYSATTSRKTTAKVLFGGEPASGGRHEFSNGGRNLAFSFFLQKREGNSCWVIERSLQSGLGGYN